MIYYIKNNYVVDRIDKELNIDGEVIKNIFIEDTVYNSLMKITRAIYGVTTIILFVEVLNENLIHLLPDVGDELVITIEPNNIGKVRVGSQLEFTRRR